jgi:hypothetical protein
VDEGSVKSFARASDSSAGSTGAQKIRSYQREVLAGHIYLLAYRPIWTPRGLAAHLSYVVTASEGPPTESPLGEVNLSSLHDREIITRTLGAMAGRAFQGNWPQLLATFFADVAEAERHTPVWLPDVQVPEEDLCIDVDSFPLLTRHPSILFGDGESAKSYVGLWLAGRLTQLGKRVLLCDWELSAEDHRVRLGKLFPAGMPAVLYLPCSAPITELVEDIQRCAVQEQIDYVIYDSAAFACRGPAETSEAAIGYFAALRDIGVPGSLTIAHTTKKEAAIAGQEKPFGSAFWHNSARATWLLTVKERNPNRIQATLVARKNNLANRGGDLTVDVTFDQERTVIALAAAADLQERKEAMVAFVRQHPNGVTKNAICRAVGGKKEDCLKLIKKLIDDCVCVVEGKKIVLMTRGKDPAPVH